MQGSFPTENKKSLRRFDLKKKHLPCWDLPGLQPAVQHTCEEMEPFPLPSYCLHKGRQWCLMPEEQGMGFITLPVSTGLWWPSERENKGCVWHSASTVLLASLGTASRKLLGCAGEWERRRWMCPDKRVLFWQCAACRLPDAQKSLPAPLLKGSVLSCSVIAMECHLPLHPKL